MSINSDLIISLCGSMVAALGCYLAFFAFKFKSEFKAFKALMQLDLNTSVDYKVKSSVENEMELFKSEIMDLLLKNTLKEKEHEPKDNV